MENSYDAVRRMRLVPFGLNEVTALAALTLAALLPVTLTVYSLDQLVGRVLKMMFY
jgi:ABC-type proline/glycine betaine transport system permease subunit